MQLLVVALLVIRTHLLLLDIALYVFALELIDDLLALEALLMLGDFFGLDDVVDELSEGVATLRMIWLMTG